MNSSSGSFRQFDFTKLGLKHHRNTGLNMKQLIFKNLIILLLILISKVSYGLEFNPVAECTLRDLTIKIIGINVSTSDEVNYSQTGIQQLVIDNKKHYSRIEVGSVNDCIGFGIYVRDLANNIEYIVRSGQFQVSLNDQSQTMVCDLTSTSQYLPKTDKKDESCR